ncbi:MAG: hypothetical protein VXZ35_05535, partial [Pseudomonadota bacterium]|nr:hypothetical protein [Pseudomonadota bacterium]
MFKNKHVIAALIITPILAVLGYFAVDALVSETPHAAKKGASYKLAEKPNCRYTSGMCGLKNGEFELKLTTNWLDGNRMRLHLSSVAPLDGAKISMVDDENDQQVPQDMLRNSEDGTSWIIDMNRPDREKSRLRIAVSSDGVLYYGDAGTKFTVYQTTFEG